MSKRKYIIIALLGFVLAFSFSELVFDALIRVVLPDNVTGHAFKPAGSILLYFRFALVLGLACAAIPIAFMIIRNHVRAMVIVILSLAGAGIAMFVLRQRVYASVAFHKHLGLDIAFALDKLQLEVVPWVSFGVTVLGTFFLKMKQRGADARPVPPPIPSQIADGPTGNASQ